MSDCVPASCLAHRERVFWNPYFHAWTHTDSRPCEALAREPDPTELRCYYCGQRTDVDGAGRLWTLLPGSPGRWTLAGGRWRWLDESWTGMCPRSPSGVHEVVIAVSQAPA